MLDRIKSKIEIIKRDGYDLSIASLIEEDFPSLITTIESQKEEIEKAIAEAKYQVELTLGFNQMYTDISLKLTDKNAEVESLKAITESQKVEIQKLQNRTR